MATRKRHSAEFKAKFILEALREDLTTAELAKKYDFHPTMISGWKRIAIENMAAAFGSSPPAVPQISGKEVEKLHAKIGQLVIERDFFCRQPPVSFPVLEAKSGETGSSRSERTSAMQSAVTDPLLMMLMMGFEPILQGGGPPDRLRQHWGDTFASGRDGLRYGIISCKLPRDGCLAFCRSSV